MRRIKRVTLLIWACQLLFCFTCASAEAPRRTPWRDYSILEDGHGQVELFVQYANEEAERCVISVGQGTVALESRDDQSFAWDAEKREITMTWSTERLEYLLDYKPSLSPLELKEGADYEDELIFTYYDGDQGILNQDRVTITGAYYGMLVEMESV